MKTARPGRARKAAAMLALPAALFLLGPTACSMLESATEALNVARVEFSEGSPAVDGQNVDYTGSLLQTPSLDKFVLQMVFHVKADNSRNSGTASFGSDKVKPIVDFHINSKSASPITTTIPPFSVPGGAVADLRIPLEIPVASIDKATLRKIVAGDPIPYFLTGTLQFDLFEGASSQGKGAAELDLASGEIETRPTGSAANLLSGLL